MRAAERSTVWTIGHSTRTVDAFVAALAAHGIELIADVRRFPASRRQGRFGSAPNAAYGRDTASARTAMERWEREHPEPPVSLADVADHLDHVRAIAGADHVGLGSDFDGMFSRNPGLDDASALPALLRELAARGWTEPELAGLTGGNFLRVLERAERVAAAANGR